MVPVIRGNSLYVVVQGGTWQQSEEFSKRLGGHLASINSEAENSFIVNSSLKSEVVYNGRKGDISLENKYVPRAWIGLNDIASEGDYQWISGDPLTYRGTIETHFSGEEDAYGRFNPVTGAVDDALPLITAYINQDAAVIQLTDTKDEDGSVNTFWKAGSWEDTWGNYSRIESGIAEITVDATVSINFASASSTREDDEKEIKTTIGLRAGSNGTTDLLEGARIYWVLEGIKSSDLISGYALSDSLSGSGIVQDGKLRLTHKIRQGVDTANFSVKIYSDENLSTEIKTANTDYTPPFLDLSDDLRFASSRDPLTGRSSLSLSGLASSAGSDLAGIYVRLKDPGDRDINLGWIEFTKTQASSDTYRFARSILLPTEASSGEYRVGWIRLVDAQGNSRDYWNRASLNLDTRHELLPTIQSTTATNNQLILTFSEDIQIAGGGTLNPAYMTVTVDGQARKVTRSQILPPNQPSIHTASQLALALSGRSLDGAKSISISYNQASNGSNAGFITDLDGNALASIAAQVVDTYSTSYSISTRGLSSAYKNLILTGTAAAAGYGNTQDNTITGNDANNTLDGLAGADTMIGKGGNDIYFVDNVGDVVSEVANEGIDTVQSTIAYTLTENLENLTLLGSAAINGTGNISNNTITGNSASNILNGNGGTDALIGGKGSDTYIVDSGDDIITESGSSSDIDSVQSSVSWILGINLENLALTGSSAIDGTGNDRHNIIIGNSANNTIDGGNGGTDRLTGLAGADVFRFSTRPSSFRNTTADHITDFSSAQGDKIQITKSAFGITASTATLSLVNGANALSAALSGSSMFVYDTSSGELHWNQNGLSKGAGSGGVLAILDNRASLSANDLSLI